MAFHAMSLPPPDDDIYEESGALPSWTQFFDMGDAYLDVRDTTPTVCFVPELDNKWGFKVMKAYDEHKAYNAMGEDHYIALRLNDWVCPRADFWVEDLEGTSHGHERWSVGDDQGWTFVSTCNPEIMLVEHACHSKTMVDILSIKSRSKIIRSFTAWLRTYKVAHLVTDWLLTSKSPQCSSLALTLSLHRRLSTASEQQRNYARNP